jgi:photosystem II stability/assembly factor-like uncharacterized protein
MTTYYLAPNSLNNGVYTGEFYAIDTSGGFTIDQSFTQIPFGQNTPITQYDVTQALQIVFDVNLFNTRIGVIKDASNVTTLSSSVDACGNLLTNSLTITTSDFLNNVTTNSILSMGSLSTLYSDFNNTVLTYFGMPNGFASLFAAATGYSINGGIFNETNFVHLINGNTFDVSGSYISDLSGYFTVNSINTLLNFACQTDVMGNRPNNMYNISDGFFEGDLFFIPKGITINLSVDIEAELPGAKPINIGPINLQAQDASFNYAKTNVNVYKTTKSTVTNISQSYEVPILIVLKNNVLQQASNFGQYWVVLYSSQINWLAISMNSSGEYQAGINDTGNIFVSSDYGQTWSIKYNIGIATSNCVAISYTGQYQTASNGENIYISIDYGMSWSLVFNLGKSNIFLCISLTGQYQTIVSCGDTVYTSNNYGLTWSGITDTNLDIYNSIETFPTAGLAISYNGQYQTIVSENIYLSSDYGVTWINVSPQNNLDDRNWEGVAMSSTGHYQTAIDSGGDIYTSLDYGNTWTYVNHPNVIDREWQAIAMSSSGEYQIALEKQGSVFISTDFGLNWTISTSTLIQNRNWQAITMSSNGLYITIAEYGGSLYGSILTTL